MIIQLYEQLLSLDNINVMVFQPSPELLPWIAFILLYEKPTDYIYQLDIHQ